MKISVDRQQVQRLADAERVNQLYEQTHKVEQGVGGLRNLLEFFQANNLQSSRNGGARPLRSSSKLHEEALETYTQTCSVTTSTLSADVLSLHR